MDIESQRLFISPITVEQAQKLMLDAESYPNWLGTPYDALWPGNGLKAMLPIYAEALENRETELGFGPWIIMDKHKQMVIGDIGFKGQPVNGEVEIGYFVSKIHRNQGYAKEAVEAMLQWAFSHEDIVTVTASCSPSNVPSYKVLSANGFKERMEEDGLIWFEARKERHYGKNRAM
ncbi:GNAT family N-acetyltransferase [Pontibacillus salicampi]|uniref:GNAT family N-acetyltransferase n=1 Tax=Pontibacillus salicampi TaxID=1449801 RepID=A0ABV6LP31_9BACI